MTNHQNAFEGYNRISAFLNGEKYVAPASLSAPPVQPAPRIIKSLAQVLDEELAAGLLNATAEPVEAFTVDTKPQVILSVEQASRRVVKSLRQILSEESGSVEVAPTIKCFQAISNSALKNEALPTRLKIFGWGESETVDGNYRAGDKTSALLAANQKRLGFERVAIDFNHCTVPGTDAALELTKAGQPPLIFGYGRVNPITGDGIYLEDITWTPLGIQHARNFEDISPALKDDNREVIMIHSVALTPNGKVSGLQFFSALMTPTQHEP